MNSRISPIDRAAHAVAEYGGAAFVLTLPVEFTVMVRMPAAVRGREVGRGRMTQSVCSHR